MITELFPNRDVNLRGKDFVRISTPGVEMPIYRSWGEGHTIQLTRSAAPSTSK